MRLRRSIFCALAVILAAAGCSHIEDAIKPVSFKTFSPAESTGVRAAASVGVLKTRLERSPGRAVLLPFSDYSAHNSPATHVATHKTLQELLTNGLRSAGMDSVLSGNEIASFLVGKGVILEAAPLVSRESPRTAAALEELDGAWTDRMSDRIGQTVHQNLINIGSGGSADVPSRPLSENVIREIADRYAADYVIRGRVTVYESGLELQDYPYPEETLAFYFPDPDRTRPFIGIADVASYEIIDGRPLPPPREAIRSEDNTPYETLTQKITPIVRLDIFVQDVVAGEIVFVNSVEVRAAELKTVTLHGHSHGHNLAGRALRPGVESLLEPLI